MAQTVLRVNKLAADEESSAGQMANAILDDYALTNKVLRVVNSAIYGRSTEVTTISRAIVVLGWNPIRNLVLTFKLFDSLPDSDNKEDIKSLMGEAFCTGMVARNVAKSFSSVRDEQAFICGLFYDFGQLLVQFYLPEAQKEIQQLVRNNNKKPSGAARMVLGIDYAELGMSIAEELRFPKLLVCCMQPRPRARVRGRPTPTERLSGIVAMSDRVKTALLARTKPSATQANVAEIFKDFERKYGQVITSPESVIADTLEVMEEHASILGLPVRSGELVTEISKNYFVRPPERTTDVTRAARAEVAETPQAILATGVQEAARTSLRSLNEVLLVVLETMFRGLGHTDVGRAVFLIRDPSKPQLRYRCGLGGGLSDAAEWFAVPINSGRDIFNLAIAERKDVVLSDVSAIGVNAAYPAVYRSRAFPTGYAVLLPIAVRDKPIGVFFIEGRRPCALDEEHLGLLKQMRDEVVRRIEQASLVAA